MGIPPRIKPVSRVLKSKRIESIDLLRGTVMIIMALDHVRDYFHKDAFLYDPTDLTKTSGILFFTRFITHYCAPIFVFLAGISAYLYGSKKTRQELSFFLFTRGIWLVFVEFFIIAFEITFNPTYPIFFLQVIWAIGLSMIVLSAMVYMNKHLILFIGILLIAGHNLLDGVHVPGTGPSSFLWSVLHDPGDFHIGRFTIMVKYPVLPWIGIIAVGYYFGSLYRSGFNEEERKGRLIIMGAGAIALFVFLRALNIYGDPAPWSIQKSPMYSFMSFLNVTKYPPSLLYTLITLGPALFFLALSEKPLNSFTEKVSVFGRVPMFYYLAHRLLIHLFAVVGAAVSGYKWTDMVMLTTSVYRMPELKGYGFNLFITYLVWIGLIFFLYPFCKWFDRYKRTHQQKQWWLSYL